MSDVIDRFRYSVMRTVSPATLNSPDGGLAIAGLGMAGEMGEVVEIIKKHLAQGHEIDRDKFIKEMGDKMWYDMLALIIMDISLEEVMEANIKKLEERYPTGFSSERSLNRKGEE